MSISNQKEVQDKRNECILAEKKRVTLGLNLIKIFGDMIPAGQASETFKNVFGWTANDKLCGLGGFVSALITSYQLYEWVMLILFVEILMNEKLNICDWELMKYEGWGIIEWIELLNTIIEIKFID